MARVKKANGEGPDPLTARANFRLTSDEFDLLTIESEAAGMSLSRYLRRRVFGRPVIARIDRQVVNELRRLGGLLKQVHVETRGAYRDETALTIRAVREAIDRLATP